MNMWFILDIKTQNILHQVLAAYAVITIDKRHINAPLEKNASPVVQRSQWNLAIGYY